MKRQKALRASLAETEQKLKTLRAETDALRETRSQHSANDATLTADLKHLEETCLNDLGVEAVTLREDAEIARIEGEALAGRRRKPAVASSRSSNRWAR